MVNTSEKFLIDANTLMAAARLYYAYDLVPSFWEIFGIYDTIILYFKRWISTYIF